MTRFIISLMSVTTNHVSRQRIFVKVAFIYVCLTINSRIDLLDLFIGLDQPRAFLIIYNLSHLFSFATYWTNCADCCNGDKLNFVVNRIVLACHSLTTHLNQT